MTTTENCLAKGCSTKDLTSYVPSNYWVWQAASLLLQSRRRELHRVQCRVQTYRALHDDAPQYLRHFTSVADIPTHQRVEMSATKTSVFHFGRSVCSCCQTVGRRAFSVAGACVWNALPADVTSAPSLQFTFRKRLKLHLFSLSYAGLVH